MLLILSLTSSSRDCETVQTGPVLVRQLEGRPLPVCAAPTCLETTASLAASSERINRPPHSRTGRGLRLKARCTDGKGFAAADRGIE